MPAEQTCSSWQTGLGKLIVEHEEQSRERAKIAQLAGTHVHVSCESDWQVEPAASWSMLFSCQSTRQRCSVQRPLIPPIEPTGHPPTSDSSKMVSTIRVFEGSLEDLLRACANAPPGTVFDLDGATIESNVDYSVMELSNERSSSDNSNASSEGDTSSYLISTHGDAITATQPVTIGSARKLAPTTVGMSPDRRSFDSTYVQLCNSCMPRGSFSSLHDGIRSEVSGLMTSPSPFDDFVTSPLSVDTPDISHISSSGMLTRLRSVSSDACIQPRQIQKTVSASIESLRGTCEIDPKRAVDCLQPSCLTANLPCITLTAADVSIRNGTLQLPAEHLLLIENSRLTLSGIEIIGSGKQMPGVKSYPLVYISDSEAELLRVSVLNNSHGHGVGIGVRAKVSMQHCHATGHKTCGVVVRGVESSLSAQSCVFSRNSQDGIVVSSGATVHLSDCHFIDNGMLGLGVSQETSAVVATQCRSVGNGKHGFAVYGGAKLTLEEPIAEANDIALLALDSGTQVTVSGGKLSNNRQGFHVCEGAEAMVKGTTIAGHVTGCIVSHTDSCLTLERCNILGSSGTGVQVLAGSVCNIIAGEVTGCKNTGVVVQHVNSTANLRQVLVGHNGQAGVHASVMGRAELENCHLTGNKVSGIQATDSDTSVRLIHCMLTSNSTIGAFVNKGAFATLINCQISQNGSSGCEVRDRQSQAKIVGGSLRENGRVGAYVHSSAVLDLHSTSVSKNEVFALLCGGRSGADIGGGVVTHCTDTTIEGGNMMRHGGRIYTNAALAANSADTNILTTESDAAAQS